MSPLFTLIIGIAIVISMIVVLRLNAFVALITAAIVVSLLAPGALDIKIQRVADAFGDVVGKIGIVIALAAVIGKCMMDSGAADRIVRAFLGALGEKRSPYALMGSGFTLAVPVFFDTVFYLLVPLARSLYRQTRKNYLLYLLAIGAGAAITHTLVPPTPGPLTMAAFLGVDIGMMILVGAMVALPSAFAGVVYARIANKMMPIEMREVGDGPEPEPIPDEELPGLFVSLLPIVLPVLMIAVNTVVDTVSKADQVDASQVVVGAAVAGADDDASAAETTGFAASQWDQTRKVAKVIGDANLALFVSMVIALILYYRARKPSLAQLSETMEEALMSGGVIILITAGGGAFGAMLKAAQVGDAIKDLFNVQAGDGIGISLLLLGFCISVLIKIAQGSSTVAMITAAGMLAPLIAGETLPFHPVYLATSIGAGSLVGSWMNDSGFWIFAKMGGLTETEGLKTWTPMLSVLGIVSLLTSILLATVLPFV